MQPVGCFGPDRQKTIVQLWLGHQQAGSRFLLDCKVQRYLVYLQYWTLNLRPLMVYPKVLFPPTFIIIELSVLTLKRDHLCRGALQDRLHWCEDN